MQSLNVRLVYLGACMYCNLLGLGKNNNGRYIRQTNFPRFDRFTLNLTAPVPYVY